MIRMENKQRGITKTDTLRFSIRVYSDEFPSGKVTTITLNKKIVILWVMFGTKNMTLENKQGIHDRIEFLLTEFIYETLNHWKHPDGSGLSNFVTDHLIRDFLSKKDYKKYNRLYKGI